MYREGCGPGCTSIIERSAMRVVPGEDRVEPWARCLMWVLTAGETRELSPHHAHVLAVIPRIVRGAAIDVSGLTPLAPAEFATLVKDPVHRQAFIAEVVAIQLAGRDPAPEIETALEQAADALQVGSEVVDIARDTASGASELIAADIRRAVRPQELFKQLLENIPDEYQRAVAESPLHQPDPELTRRWRSCEDSPDGTLGRALADHYHRHGYPWPGTPEAAAFKFGELLARHDIAHVVADYSVSPMGEMEVFTF